MTLTGRTMFPEPHLLDIDQESISAHDLLYTMADTTSVLEDSGAHLVPGDIETIYSMTGGLPVLVRRSISVLKNLPTESGREHLLRHNLRRVIQHYTQECIAAEAHVVGQYDLVVATAPARELTVDTVTYLLESDESPQQIRDRLIALEAAGVISYVDTGVVETWRLAPAIRQSILTSHPVGEVIRPAVCPPCRAHNSMPEPTHRHSTMQSRHRTGHWQSTFSTSTGQL